MSDERRTAPACHVGVRQAYSWRALSESLNALDADPPPRPPELVCPNSCKALLGESLAISSNECRSNYLRLNSEASGKATHVLHTPLPLGATSWNGTSRSQGPHLSEVTLSCS